MYASMIHDLKIVERNVILSKRIMHKVCQIGLVRRIIRPLVKLPWSKLLLSKKEVC